MMSNFLIRTFERCFPIGDFDSVSPEEEIDYEKDRSGGFDHPFEVKFRAATKGLALYFLSG
jgi:hypothetical protein